MEREERAEHTTKRGGLLQKETSQISQLGESPKVTNLTKQVFVRRGEGLTTQSHGVAMEVGAGSSNHAQGVAAIVRE